MVVVLYYYLRYNLSSKSCRSLDFPCIKIFFLSLEQQIVLAIKEEGHFSIKGSLIYPSITPKRYKSYKFNNRFLSNKIYTTNEHYTSRR